MKIDPNTNFKLHIMSYSQFFSWPSQNLNLSEAVNLGLRLQFKNRYVILIYLDKWYYKDTIDANVFDSAKLYIFYHKNVK